MVSKLDSSNPTVDALLNVLRGTFGSSPGVSINKRADTGGGAKFRNIISVSPWRFNRDV